MKRILLSFTFLFVVLSTAIVRANAFQIDLGVPPGTQESDVSVQFSGLNGAFLSGQTLSLDFTFANAEFIRLFSVTTSYEIGLRLQTDHAGFAGFVQGSGYITDARGNAMSPLAGFGSASTDTGVIFGALLPLYADDNGTPNTDLVHPLDQYGFHFELTLPSDQSVQITDGMLTFDAGGGGPFGVGPGLPADVPEPGTVSVIAIALSSLAIAKRLVRSKLP